MDENKDFSQDSLSGEELEHLMENDGFEKISEDAETSLPETLPEEAHREEIPVRTPQDTPAIDLQSWIPSVDDEEPADEAVPASDMLTPEEAIPEDPFTAPETQQEILPEEDAMVFHGMAEPGQPEEEFDMDLLNGLDESDEESPRKAPDSQETDLLSEPSREPECPGEREYRDDADDEEFDQLLHAEPEKEEVPSHKRPAYKGRPKHRKGEGFFGIPNILTTVVWLAITVLIGVTLGRMAWVCAADVLAFGREDKPVTVTIYEADTIEDITQKLHEADLIRYPGLFKLYASLAVDEGEIHPGIWDLNTRYDYHALVNMMSPSSSREVIEVMIPEGYTCRQIFALLEENKICTAIDLASYAANGELDDYWFLENVQRGDRFCLEGFLFPDTYQFYKNEAPRNVLQKMLNNFDARFAEEMQAQIPTLNERNTILMQDNGKSEDFIAENQLDIRDVITVASLIEKETSSSDEGYTISSVIYNRLYNWGDTPAFLNIDAAIVYALNGKTDLTQQDLKVDSPYNTYTHQGLTPGPISNPGLSSIKAALAPSDTNYYYYVLDPAQGAHRFTTTYEEHQEAIASMEG